MKRVLSKGEANRTFDLIKLIKTVYTGNIFISKTGIDMDMIYDYSDNVANAIFRVSYFSHIVDKIMPELTGCITMVPTLYDAFHDGVETVEVASNGHIMFGNKAGEEHCVGLRVTDDVHDKYMGNMFVNIKDLYELLTRDGDDGPEYTYDNIDMPAEDILRLINYDTITVRNKTDSDIGIILTCKCFPNIKKCNGIDISWVYKDDEEMYKTMVKSQFMSDKYPSNPVVFTMIVDTLRC